MKIDCSIDCLTPRDKWHLGIDHHGWRFLGDGLDHAFGNTILMVSVGRTWFLCCAVSIEHQSDGHVVIFSVAMIAPKLGPLVSHGVNSSLK